MKFDVRTKIYLTLLIAVICIGFTTGAKFDYLHFFLKFIPFVLLILSKKWKLFLVTGIIFVTSALIDRYFLAISSGLIHYILFALGAVLNLFTSATVMAVYTVMTTTPSEFIAGLKKMHCPAAITIPFAVLFRFFPTIAQEFRSINEAMKMREIRFGGKKVSKVLEYKIIPMMMCIMRIGEELSMSALVRGLENNNKRTSVIQPKFKVQDFIIFALSIFCLVLDILKNLGSF